MCLFILNKLSRYKYILFIVVIVISSIITNQIINLLSPDLIELTELSKCPACYGTCACAKIFSNSFKIDFLNFYTILSHLFAAKNVFYGSIGKTKIVFKKLAHDQELKLFDDMICENENLSHLCVNVNKNHNDIDCDVNKIDYLSLIKSEVSLNISNANAKLVLCPNTNHLENLLNLSQNYTFSNNDYIYLWTLIKINPEPIILKILRADEGWPVAKYYGACGRVVVEKYAGLPLTLYYHESWLRRAKIAIGLLESVNMFTFRNPEYSFYFTDLSPDNIVIDENDRPVFIDLENIIVLHKNISIEDQPKEWNNLHTSDNIDCNNCFSFSPTDICSHRISDHNYYSICQQILSDKSKDDGFLHSIPVDILHNYKNLKAMIDECALPHKIKSRIEAGDELKKILQRILIDFHYE
ncbi:divergent protein kinase domain 2A isoform X1 [Microplitis mediator]|uniref:divergent protein kinase domain 2A isoform X1 n=1 Tax=Microplitis mediator TaxID=375433 RepID=UPI0025537E74|nr:divergent protein kinase domain 2A isoform X1 [Microplitis mediator]